MSPDNQRDGPSDERTVLAGGPACVASATLSVPGSLFATTEGAPDIFPRLLRPKGEPAPEEPLGRTSRFGLRLGLLIPTSAEEGSWESAARLGLYYRSGRKIAFELGVDYASVDGEYGPGETVTSKMYFLRFDTVFGFSSGDARTARFFLLGGGELGLESATWEPTGDTADRESGSLNIGAGIGSPSGSWDARVVYSIFVGSDNAAGAVMTAFGYAF